MSGFTIGVTLTMLPLASVHVKGPTEAVISTPWLRAVARRVRTWFCERHRLVALNLRLQAAGKATCDGQAGGGEFSGGTGEMVTLSIGG